LSVAAFLSAAGPAKYYRERAATEGTEGSMLSRRKTLVAIAVWALAMPAAAQEPTPPTTAFDGTYIGGSRTFEEATQPEFEGHTWSRFCPQFGRPATLTIVNGIARSGKAEGSVSPQGNLVMRDFWSHIDGRVDGQGTVRARVTGNCNYQLVWQKAPPPTMSFDGDYVGVSRESSCLASGVPATLIVRNSVVSGASWQGNVNPQGVVVMGNRLAPRVDGQIDSQGIMRAQGSSTDGGCTVTFVWRKQPGWRLSAESALDKGDDNIEAAVAREILMPGVGREPTLFGLGCSVEHGAALAPRDDAVALAVKDQSGRLDLADPWERVETVDDHPGGRHVREVALRDLGDATRLVRNTTFVL
jgi:hypothetical protein